MLRNNNGVKNVLENLSTSTVKSFALSVANSFLTNSDRSTEKFARWRKKFGPTRNFYVVAIFENKFVWTYFEFINRTANKNCADIVCKIFVRNCLALLIEQQIKIVRILFAK
jgi:hypothetical protein